MALLQGTNVNKIQSDINMECIKKKRYELSTAGQINFAYSML